MSTSSPAARGWILSNYRQLLRLIYRLPQQQQCSALAEARQVMHARQHSSSPEATLQYTKELAAKIAYLKVITPRRPSDATQAGATYVFRDGQWVEGKAADMGNRVADGTLSWDEAVARNKRDFKRFYGADKPKDVFF